MDNLIWKSVKMDKNIIFHFNDTDFKLTMSRTKNTESTFLRRPIHWETNHLNLIGLPQRFTHSWYGWISPLGMVRLRVCRPFRKVGKKFSFRPSRMFPINGNNLIPCFIFPLKIFSQYYCSYLAVKPNQSKALVKIVSSYESSKKWKARSAWTKLMDLRMPSKTCLP